MYICQKCNYSSETSSNFCPLCGNPMISHNPTYTTTAPKSYLAKKITGMVLSLNCFILAVIAGVYSLILAIIPDEVAVASGLVITVYFALFGLPGSIIGLIFSNQVRNLGDTSRMSSSGKGLGLAGIIIFAASFVVSLLGVISQY